MKKNRIKNAGKYFRNHELSLMTIAAPFSPIMIVGAFVLPEVMYGILE